MNWYREAKTSLEEEARKYKTAEEFLRQIEWHGTRSENIDKILKDGFKVGWGQKGVSTTQDPEEAAEYAESAEDAEAEEAAGSGAGDVIAVYVRPGARMAGKPGVDFLTGTGSFHPKDLIPLPKNLKTEQQIADFWHKTTGK